MSPLLKALLHSWDLRIEVLIPLLLLGGLYLRGWLHLNRLAGRRTASGSRRNRRAPLAARWKLACYLSGLLIMVVALMSPIDVLGSQLFTMHMIQHLLLVMLAPPLLLIATPFPIVLWGLPRNARHKIGSLFSGESPLRSLLTAALSPGIVWFVYTAVYLGWHDPNAYNAALRGDLMHDLEHISFFVTAMFFWWHVSGVGPRFHRTFSTGARLAYVIAAIPVNMFTGVAIAFAEEPIYSYYTTVPRFYGISVMEDQMLSGIIMWIPGSMMYLVAALILIARIVQTEADKPVEQNPAWLVDESAATKD